MFTLFSKHRTLFWLDPTMASACGGEGGLPSNIQPFFGNKVTPHTQIWDIDLGGAGLSNFDVDANPKISISIPAASPRCRSDTAKIIDFDVVWAKIFLACGGLLGGGVNAR